MRTRYQGDDSDDCGPACVAMLAGISLEEARAAFVGKKQDRTNTEQMVAALAYLGVQIAPRPTVLRPTDSIYRRRRTLDAKLARKLRRDALLILRRKDHPPGAFHWVVWDARKGTIRDPWRPGARRLARITSYLEVLSRAPASRSRPS